jgi:hypothetical protein
VGGHRAEDVEEALCNEVGGVHVDAPADAELWCPSCAPSEYFGDLGNKEVSTCRQRKGLRRRRLLRPRRGGCLLPA